MNKERRTFLQTAGLLAAGTMMNPLLACKNASDSNVAEEATNKTMSKANPSLEKFGIQLYTLRDVIPEDPKGTLKALADMGFQQIEGYEGDQGIFWNMSHTDFKKYLDDLGIEMVASHCNIYENFEKKVAQAAEIGMDYLICPWVGPQKSKEDWATITEKFNECGKICKDNGIHFAYHNHAYSFRPFTGMIPHQFMMDNTDPDLVDFEMDIYWVVTGGADPVEYFNKYPNRFRLCHVKDRMKGAGDTREASCNLGTGIIDYPRILKAAADNGMKYFIMEQEKYENTTPLECAKVGAEYLKKIEFV